MTTTNGQAPFLSVCMYLGETEEYKEELAMIIEEFLNQRIEGMKASFMAKGMTPDVALQSAYKSLEFAVMKQASVLSYMDVFLYLGLLFLICIPFILFVKDKKGGEKIDLSEAMH